jgi:hypothetical protein
VAHASNKLVLCQVDASNGVAQHVPATLALQHDAQRAAALLHLQRVRARLI